jgi:hypothetical protein
MKKLSLLRAVCALCLLALHSTTSAAVISSDEQAHTQALMAPPSAYFSLVTPVDAAGESGKTSPVETINHSAGGVVPARSHTSAHPQFWKLLTVFVVFFVLSELCYRKFSGH